MGMLETVVGGGLGAIGGITGGIINGINDKKALQYQKDRDKITMQREDNAVQRRAKDLEDAGINPLLAAGEAAGASAGPTPVQNRAGDSIAGGIDGAIQGAMLASQIRKTNAEADFAQQQADMFGKNSEQDNALKQAQIDKIAQDTKLSTEQRNSLIAQMLDTTIKGYGMTTEQIDAGLKIAGSGLGGSKSSTANVIQSRGAIQDGLISGKLTWAEADNMLRAARDKSNVTNMLQTNKQKNKKK